MGVGLFYQSWVHYNGKNDIQESEYVNESCKEK